MERLKKVRALYEEGLKQVEIAEKLNISRRTLARDIKEIKEQIKKYNEEAVS